MWSTLSLILYGYLVATTSAVPLEHEPRQNPPPAPTLTGILATESPYWRDAYHGIYWELAEQDCAEQDFLKLVESTRMSQIFTDVGDSYWYDSAAFNRFFVRDVKANYGWHVRTWQREMMILTYCEARTQANL
jgi:hypothetical protein